MSHRRSDHEKPPDKPDRSRREKSFPVIESSSGSQRRSISPHNTMDVDFDAIFAELPSDWVIERKTHVPLHLNNKCPACLEFAKHVVDNTRGGGLAHLVELQ
jgi:hypothetical protein